MRTRHRLLTGAAATALLLTACGSDDTDAPTDEGTEEAPAEDAEDPAAGEEGGDAEGGEDSSTEELDETAEGSETTADAEDTEPPEVVSLTVETTDVGEHLATDEGRSVYVHAPDASGDEPACSTDCATVWQPVPAASEEELGEGVDEALVGTVPRDDLAALGVEEQLTYNDWPLYTFVSDAGAGDVRGQGVADLWFLIGPDGEPLGEIPSEDELDEPDNGDDEG